MRLWFVWKWNIHSTNVNGKYTMLWILHACSSTILQYVLWPNWIGIPIQSVKIIFHNSSSLHSLEYAYTIFTAFSTRFRCFSFNFFRTVLTQFRCFLILPFSLLSRSAATQHIERSTEFIAFGLTVTMPCFMFAWSIATKTRFLDLYKTFIKLKCNIRRSRSVLCVTIKPNNIKCQENEDNNFCWHRKFRSIEFLAQYEPSNSRYAIAFWMPVR